MPLGFVAIRQTPNGKSSVFNKAKTKNKPKMQGRDR
jgi:hypothetical protein